MCSNKKVPKEVDLGEALTVMSFVTSPVTFLFYPAIKPSSPKTPSRPLSAAGFDRLEVESSSIYRNNYAANWNLIAIFVLGGSGSLRVKILLHLWKKVNTGY